jgi:pimeloyl-ACP methyl ester carboxylesterase
VPIEQRTIATERGDAAWLEAGSGWPVVLLHGFPFHAEMWRPQLQLVPQGWRFIAPDFRGFGRTTFHPPAEGVVTMDTYAADVGALMDALKIEEAVIGGLSMGGYVAFAMFRQEPARFTSMLLADTKAPGDTAEGRAGRVRLREILAQQGPAAVADQMLPKLLSSDASANVVADVRGMIEAGAPSAMDAAIEALMTRPDSTPDLPRISCGTLIVVGDRDAITPASESDAMQLAIPRSQLAVIPGAGHVSNVEQPAAFSRVLADFLLSRL